MTREEKIALLVDELEDIRCDNFDADTNEDKTLKEAVRVIKTLEQEPCGDCVNRQLVLDKKELVELEDGQSFYCISPEDVKNIPPVTSQSEAGHWIDDVTLIGAKICRCSKCNSIIPKPRIKPNFCSNCGTKMEREK